jgi:hypothetical protein
MAWEDGQIRLKIDAGHHLLVDYDQRRYHLFFDCRKVKINKAKCES